MKLYMFRAVRLSIIRSLFTVHLAKVYVIQVCRQLSSSQDGTSSILTLLGSGHQTCMKHTSAECTVENS